MFKKIVKSEMSPSQPRYFLLCPGRRYRVIVQILPSSVRNILLKGDILHKPWRQTWDPISVLHLPNKTTFDKWIHSSKTQFPYLQNVE